MQFTTSKAIKDNIVGSLEVSDVEDQQSKKSIV